MVTVSTGIPDIDPDLLETIGVISRVSATLAEELLDFPAWAQESARKLIVMAAMDIEHLIDVHFERHSTE